MPGAAFVNAAVAHGAVLLAGGASTRLGRPKQLVEIDGEPLLRRVARALLATHPVDCIVVLGHDAARLGAVLAGLDVRTVTAADHATGMAASLRAGVAALDARCAGVLVALTDQPALDEAHLRALCDAWQHQPYKAVASAYANTRGVPALLPRGWFDAIAKLSGDTGARDLLRARGDDLIAIDAPRLAHDLDTPGDLHGLG